MIEQKLMQYLPDPNTIKENIGAAVDMLQEQAPLLVKELMRWHFCQSLLFFLCGLAFGVAVIIVTKTVFNKVRDAELALEAANKYADESLKFISLLLFSLLIPAIVIMGSNLIWLKIWIAPRLFLMEYITNIFK